MRNSTKYQFKYTWGRFLADIIWLTVIVASVVKIMETVSK